MKTSILSLLALACWSLPALAQQPPPPSQNCPLSYGNTDAAKNHTLFLYFPASDDNQFENFITGSNPVASFDAGKLNSAMSNSTAALIDRVRTVVADDYCEFNVQVKAVTANPDPGNTGQVAGLPPHRATVAIGGDDTGKDAQNNPLWGWADGMADIGFARVWAGHYIACEGSPCTQGLLTGPGTSTNNLATATLIDRWAQAIGGSAAHEGGHTYGLEHTDDDPPKGAVEPGQNPPVGEDPYYRHLMPAGYYLDAPSRINYRRHFSNTSYGILATNVGLSIQTMHNWDLVNPNQAQASSLSLFFVSPPQQAINLAWSYDGAESPWIDPQVDLVVPNPPNQPPMGPPSTVKTCPPSLPVNCTARAGPYNTDAWNMYRVTWSKPNPKYNGTGGVLNGGNRFHIGATFTGVDFNQPDPIIIWGATLYDSTGTPLPLHPRLPMYDTGSADGSGGFSLNMRTPPQGPPLQLKEARIYQLPRVATIDSMIGNGQPRGFDGELIEPWRVSRCQPGSLADGRHCLLGHAEDRPHVLIRHLLGEVGVIDCVRRVTLPPLRDLLPYLKVLTAPRRGRPDAGLPPDAEGPICAGERRDPFPSTTVYMIATFVDPQARHWVPALRHYVTGPVTSRVFYQFAGVRQPDKLWHPNPDHPNPDHLQLAVPDLPEPAPHER